MSHRETLSEREAAEMIGWTSSALRSHRLRAAAQATADRLTPELRGRLAQWTDGESRSLEVHERNDLQDLLRPDELPARLNRQGAEVARRCRVGPRATPCASPPDFVMMGEPPLIRYYQDVVKQWMVDHPEVVQASRLKGETMDEVEAAARVGLQVSTLRSCRSKAARATIRRDLGSPRRGDRVLIAGAPRWVWVGSEKRYRAEDLDRWTAERRRDDPLVRERDDQRGALLDDGQLAQAAGLQRSVVAGYRMRARSALRWLDQWPGALGAGAWLDRYPVARTTVLLWAQRFPGFGAALSRVAALEPGRWAELRALLEVGEAGLLRRLARSRAVPRHVLVDGTIGYHEADVADWLAERQARRPGESE